MVTQPPPLGGAAFEHHQILRAEQHRGQNPGQLGGGLLFGAVSVDLPGTGAGKQHKAHGLIPLLGENLRLQLRELGAETDHFRRFLGPEAFAGAAIGDCLQ